MNASGRRKRQKTSARRAEAADIASLLAGLAPPVPKIARELRRLIREIAPESREAFRPGWRALTYASDRAGYFCGLFPRSDRVRLYFEYGVLLPDPSRILQGETRQTRMIDFSAPGDIEALRPALDMMIRAAATLARPRGFRSRQMRSSSL